MPFAKAGDVDGGDVDDLRKLIDADFAVGHDAIQTGDDGHCINLSGREYQAREF